MRQRSTFMQTKQTDPNYKCLSTCNFHLHKLLAHCQAPGEEIPASVSQLAHCQAQGKRYLPQSVSSLIVKPLGKRYLPQSVSSLIVKPRGRDTCLSQSARSLSSPGEEIPASVSQLTHCQAQGKRYLPQSVSSLIVKPRGRDTCLSQSAPSLSSPWGRDTCLSQSAHSLSSPEEEVPASVSQLAVIAGSHCGPGVRAVVLSYVYVHSYSPFVSQMTRNV